MKGRINANFDSVLLFDNAADAEDENDIPARVHDTISQFTQTRIPEIKAEIHGIVGMIDSLEKTLRNPVRVMKKRDAKQLVCTLLENDYFLSTPPL